MQAGISGTQKMSTMCQLGKCCEKLGLFIKTATFESTSIIQSNQLERVGKGCKQLEKKGSLKNKKRLFLWSRRPFVHDLTLAECIMEDKCIRSQWVRHSVSLEQMQLSKHEHGFAPAYSSSPAHTKQG